MRLFDRARGRVVPNAFGDVVVRRGRLLLGGHEDLLREIEALTGARSDMLRVELGPHAGAISGIAAVGRVSAEHPQIRISTHVHDSSRELIGVIIDGRADLGLLDLSLASGDARLRTELVAEHAGVFFTRPGHPIGRRTGVPLSTLLEFPWVSSRLPPRIASTFPKSLGRAGRIDAETGDFVPAIQIDSLVHFADVLTDTDALALVPLVVAERALAEKRIAMVRTAGIELKTQYAFVHRTIDPPGPAALAYMQAVRAIEKSVGKREQALLRRYVRP